MGALSDEAKMQKRKNLKSPTDTEINSIGPLSTRELESRLNRCLILCVHEQSFLIFLFPRLISPELSEAPVKINESSR